MKIGDWVKPAPAKMHPSLARDYGSYKGVLIGYAWKDGDPVYDPTFALVLWEEGSGFTLHWTICNLVLCEDAPIFRFHRSPDTVSDVEERMLYYQRTIGDINEDDLPTEDGGGQ